MSNTDKLNTLVSSSVQFTTGERLKAEKLNYLIDVLETNINHLGAAIGDIYDENVSPDLKERSEWGKQFDSNNPATDSKKRRFDIANLARLIGPASNLNPQAVRTINDPITITEEVPEGVIEYCFKYPIKSSVANIEGYANVINKENFIGPGLYYIENNTIYFSNATDSEKTISYDTDPREYNGGPNYQGASFNVYPDPNQDDLENKLTVQYDQDPDGNVSYIITLPSIQNQQGSFAHNFETTSLDNSDINLGSQLKWPEWIRNLDDNSIIPSHSLYLKNYSLNESYLDAIYTKVSDTEILVTNLQIGNQECIDNYDLRVITVGTDITTSIDDLRNKMFLHKHDGSFGEPKINIKDITGFYETEAPSGPYYPSSTDWNHLSGYLHRDGYQPNSDIVNGDNAMRGPLMMGLVDFDPITNKEISSDQSNESSYGIYFGSDRAYLKKFANKVLSLISLEGKLSLYGADGVEVVGQENSFFNTLPEKELGLNSTLFLKEYRTETFRNSVEPEKDFTGVQFKQEKSQGIKVVKRDVCTLSLRDPETFTFNQYAFQDGKPEYYADMLRDILTTSNGSYNYDSQEDGYTNANRFYEISTTKGNASVIDMDWASSAEYTYVHITSNALDINYVLNLYYEHPRTGNPNIIISPLFRIFDNSNTTNSRFYRQTDVKIDRGQAWYNYLKSIKEELGEEIKNHTFEVEYTIKINSKLMSELGNRDFDRGLPYIWLLYDFELLNGTPGQFEYKTNTLDFNGLDDTLTFFKEYGIQEVKVNAFGQHIQRNRETADWTGSNVTYRDFIRTGNFLDNLNYREDLTFNNQGFIMLKYGSNFGDSSVQTQNALIANGLKIKETFSNGIFYVEVL